MNQCHLPFSTQAEHVGVIRCSDGSNLPAITSRIAAHTKSIFHLLECGGARAHRGNPASALAIERLYSAPTIYGGVAILVLSKAELGLITQHQKLTLQRLQRLYPRSPRAAVFLLSGCLPAPGIIARKKFSLIGMIARLGPTHVLYRHALYFLHHQIKSTWCHEVRELSIQYSLPDPLSILLDPPSKVALKKLVKSSITAYWHQTIV